MRAHIVLLIAALVVPALGPAMSVRAQQSRAERPVTFTEHVAPILYANCVSCHRPGEAAPFSLLTYRDARPLARAIATATTARAMPPWKAAPSDVPYKNARRLSDKDIATLTQWAAEGATEGDPSRLPRAPTFTDGWRLGPPDIVVTMPDAFDVPATGPDVYRTFAVPIGNDKDVWVRAVEFRPSARTVVHHSLFFLDATGAARERDARDPLPGYAGGMGGGVGAIAGGRGRGQGMGGLALLLGGGGAADQPAGQAVGALGGWAPGGRPLELPEGLAHFVPRGADLLLSTHFHPSGTPAREQSRVGLYLAAAPPTQAFTTIQLPPLFGVFEGLEIPAGDASYTIRDSFTIPIDVRAFEVGGHAHYLGKSMKLTATIPGGGTKTLLSIEDWDFGWQERYPFQDFVALPAGTRLDVEVRYDNSSGNRRNPSRPPVSVSWGEESNDEMGSIGLQVVAARASELPVLQQAIVAHVRQAALSRPGLRQLLQRRGREGGPRSR